MTPEEANSYHGHPDKIRELFGDSDNFTDARNALRTTSLIKETRETLNQTYHPWFTIRETDRFGCVSLKAEFMKDADPTGYTTAMRVFGSYPHWERMRRNKFIGKHIKMWEEELEVKLRSEAIKKMRKMDSPTAAKWLATRGWDGGAPNVRGRPTKDEVTRERKIQAAIMDEIEDDAKRVLGSIN